MQPNINICIEGKRVSAENPMPVTIADAATPGQVDAIAASIDALTTAIHQKVQQPNP